MNRLKYASLFILFMLHRSEVFRYGMIQKSPCISKGQCWKWEIILKYEGVLISPQSDLLPDVVQNRWCRWKEGSVNVPNCKSFLVTEAERKHVRRRSRFQQHRDASSYQIFFPLQGKAPKEIYPILTETIRGTFIQHTPHFVESMLNKSRVWQLQIVSFLVGLRIYQNPLVPKL